MIMLSSTPLRRRRSTRQSKIRLLFNLPSELFAVLLLTLWRCQAQLPYPAGGSATAELGRSLQKSKQEQRQLQFNGMGPPIMGENTIPFIPRNLPNFDFYFGFFSGSNDEAPTTAQVEEFVCVFDLFLYEEVTPTLGNDCLFLQSASISYVYEPEGASDNPSFSELPLLISLYIDGFTADGTPYNHQEEIIDRFNTFDSNLFISEYLSGINYFSDTNSFGFSYRIRPLGIGTIQEATCPNNPIPPKCELPTPPPTPPPIPFLTNPPVASPTDPPPTYPPTEPPTGPPTDPPTDLPTFPPTEPPTSPPVVFPTPRPTLRPTTLAPTRSPTDSPTESPTRSPTLIPTNWPTVVPTPMPTWSPTEQPTLEPTPFPTRPPSRGPTRLPTRYPTRAPTTRSPTSQPSAWPSSGPSATPTASPSLLPSSSPSAHPTTETPRPTVSALPSFVPSDQPTSHPTDMPSSRPSPTPSYRPSDSPTAAPSQAPSLSLQNELVPATIVLEVSQVLTGRSIIHWEHVTATHIREALLNQQFGLESPMADLRVAVNIIRQNSNFNAEEEGLVVIADRSSRNLQEAASLQIVFDVLASFRSLVYYDLVTMISWAFDTEDKRQLYIARLYETGDEAFTSVGSVRLYSVDGSVVPTTRQAEGNTMWVIIGACAGGGAFLTLLAIFFVRRMGNKGKKDSNAENTHPTTNDGKVGLSTEILVESGGQQDEVSTLGDPIFTQAGMHMAAMDKDEVTASVGDDYDYAKQYLQQHETATAADRSRFTSEDFTRDSSAISGLGSKIGIGQMGELFSDDASFEEQYAEMQETFDVVVPAGKLGMVIDTPSGGFPIVHAIKDTSVLASRVRVGDRLMSVDGEDCTAMTAVQVSKLISLKSDQIRRTLVFTRSQMAKPMMMMNQ